MIHSKLTSRNCRTCNKEIVGRRPQSVYCSKKCRKRFEYITHKREYYERTKARRLADPDRHNAYMREYASKNRKELREKNRKRRLADLDSYRRMARESYHRRAGKVYEYQRRMAETEYTKMKHRATQTLYVAVKKGYIKRPDACSNCGKKCRTEGHHHNGYERRLDVVWLCKVCHGFEHSKVKDSKI